MKTKLFKTTALIVLMFGAYNSNYAQFEVGKSHAGPTIGLSFLGSAVQLGVNYEYGMSFKEIGIEAPGKLGIGGIFRYWKYSEDFSGGKWSYTDILIGAQANYHFTTSTGKFDPWLGLVLAYDVGSVNWDGPKTSSFSEPTHGGFWLGGHGGVRYWISPAFAISARIGFGTLSYGALDLGVDFKL